MSAWQINVLTFWGACILGASAFGIWQHSIPAGIFMLAGLFAVGRIQA